MTTQTDHKNQVLADSVEKDSTAVSAALSVHYIVLVLYALPALAGVLMIFMLIFTNNTDNNNGAWGLISLVLPTLLLAHLLAIKGLRARKKWGYTTSVVLAVILLLLFPFGTVLGAILLSQLIKFRF